ncbi:MULTISPECIES: winged helix-turn-helix domain-containing protein [Pyrococcus]|uniref:winged helix-turn-helix domain-containing protein n=1 Tax=Pyrococcus TaxID=2260 RepID=UPI001CB77186|nr:MULTISPECIES: winged helix-turn-helix domain-containing protein [Pyrococcus]
MKVLEEPMSSKEIAKRTNLSERTVRYAIKLLKDSGIVKEVYLLQDARKRVYVLSENFNDILEGSPT